MTLDGIGLLCFAGAVNLSEHDIIGRILTVTPPTHSITHSAAEIRIHHYIAKVNESLGLLLRLTLLFPNNHHSEGLPDGPQHEQNLFTGLFEALDGA